MVNKKQSSKKQELDGAAAKKVKPIGKAKKEKLPDASSENALESAVDKSDAVTTKDASNGSVVPVSAMNMDFEDQSDGCEVYDEVDQANLIQMAQTEQMLASIRQRVAPEKHPDFNGSDCVDCGDVIPKPRLAMGKVRCVSCQTEREERQKQFGRPY